MVLSADGKLAVCGSGDKTVRVWDLEPDLRWSGQRKGLFWGPILAAGEILWWKRFSEKTQITVFSLI